MRGKKDRNNFLSHKISKFSYIKYNGSESNYNGLLINKYNLKDFKRSYIDFNNCKDKKDNDDSGSTNIFRFFENLRKLLWKVEIYNSKLKNLLKKIVNKKDLLSAKICLESEKLSIILKDLKKNKFIYINNDLNKLRQFLGKNSNINNIKTLNLNNNDNKIKNKLNVVKSNIKKIINSIFSYTNIKRKYDKFYVGIIKKEINNLKQIFDAIKSTVKLIILNIIYTNIDGINNIINRGIKIVDFKGVNNDDEKNIKLINKADKNIKTIDNPKIIRHNDRDQKNYNKDNNDNFNSHNPPVNNNCNENGGNKGYGNNGGNDDKGRYKSNDPLNIIPPVIFPMINNCDDGINNNNHINGKGGYYIENDSSNNLFSIAESGSMIDDNIDQLNSILSNLKEINDNDNFDKIDNEMDYDEWDNFNLNKTEKLEDNHYYKGDIINDLEELNNELNDYLLLQDEISQNPLNP